MAERRRAVLRDVSPPQPRPGHRCRRGFENLRRIGGMCGPLPEESEESEVDTGPEASCLHSDSSDEDVAQDTRQLQGRLPSARWQQEFIIDFLETVLLQRVGPAGTSRAMARRATVPGVTTTRATEASEEDEGENNDDESEEEDDGSEDEDTDTEDEDDEPEEGDNSGSEGDDEDSDNNTYFNSWSSSRPEHRNRNASTGIGLASGAFRREGRQSAQPSAASNVPSTPAPHPRGTHMARRSGLTFFHNSRPINSSNTQASVSATALDGMLMISGLGNDSRDPASHLNTSANALEPQNQEASTQ